MFFLLQITFQLIKDYITEKNITIELYNKKNKIDKSNLINGRHLTNIGIFRVYAENYVKNNWRVDPKVAGDGYFYDLGSHQINILEFLFFDQQLSSHQYH